MDYQKFLLPRALMLTLNSRNALALRSMSSILTTNSIYRKVYHQKKGDLIGIKKNLSNPKTFKSNVYKKDLSSPK